MAFTTHCCKRPALDLRRWLLALWLSCLCGVLAAEPSAAPAPQLRLERQDDALVLSVQLDFELPAVVEDALIKGIPVYFVASAEVLRERWYWTNKRVASVQRQLRLSYQPLTRRWRVNLSAGDAGEAGQGLSLNQNYETLSEAMRAIRRMAYWKIADLSVLESGSKHVVEFSFELDTAQLPRPLQIGTQGLSDWQIAMHASQVLAPELRK